MYNCYIIDDETHCIETLKSYIANVPNLNLLGFTEDPIQALEVFKNRNDINITFLDVDMANLSGLDVAEIIKDKTSIIFTTAHSKYALNGFEINISDFLLKPFGFSKFLKSIQKVQSNIDMVKHIQQPSFNDYILVNPGVKGKMVKIELDDIFYVEGLKNYICIHTQKSKHITYLMMNEIANQLESKDFIRIHKSFIVNRKKIQIIEGSRLILSNQAELPLSSTYKESFLKMIDNRILKSHR